MFHKNDLIDLGASMAVSSEGNLDSKYNSILHNSSISRSGVMSAKYVDKTVGITPAV
jgi:hypothetical protein